MYDIFFSHAYCTFDICNAEKIYTHNFMPYINYIIYSNTYISADAKPNEQRSEGEAAVAF